MCKDYAKLISVKSVKYCASQALGFKTKTGSKSTSHIRMRKGIRQKKGILSSSSVLKSKKTLFFWQFEISINYGVKEVYIPVLGFTMEVKAGSGVI